MKLRGGEKEKRRKEETKRREGMIDEGKEKIKK